jgi:hypothetical protein
MSTKLTGRLPGVESRRCCTQPEWEAWTLLGSVIRLDSVSPSFINDPKHWRDRAQESRARAEQLDDLEAKATMLRIAADYDQLAERAEQRARGETPRSE